MDALTMFVSLGAKESDECAGVCHVIHIVTFYQCCAMLCRCLMFCVSVCYLFLLTCINSECNIVNFVSRYAVLYGRMLSLLGCNALYCSLRYSFNISSFLSSLVSPGEVCWRHHLLNVSTSLQAEVDVIKDMGCLERIKSSASHTRTVVRECCKGDDASQWENGKFDPLPRPNPLTDRHKKLHT